jgi:hypothetical protein
MTNRYGHLAMNPEVYLVEKNMFKFSKKYLDLFFYSRYGICNYELFYLVKKNIKIYDINNKLDYVNKFFDLVISINTLHNLKLKNLYQCLQEIERIGKSKFVCVESYKNEEEQFNLQCWALTAETLVDSESWKWIFNISGYTGDYEFIYF